MSRLFLSIPLPEPVRRELAGLVPSAQGLGRVPVEQLHLTLRFLGDTEEGRIEELCAVLGGVRVHSFLLTLQGLGVFPPKGPPSVLWVGLVGADPRLFQLRKEIDDRLLALGLGGQIHDFVPHVTLARLRRAGNPGALLDCMRKHHAYEGPCFRAERFQLQASELSHEGAVHTELASFALG